jgi:CcmD family protein
MPEKIALTYLFFAYAAAFAVLIGYVARTAVGTRRLEEEVERLRSEMQTMLDESAAADGLGRGAER